MNIVPKPPAIPTDEPMGVIRWQEKEIPRTIVQMICSFCQLDDVEKLRALPEPYGGPVYTNFTDREDFLSRITQLFRLGSPLPNQPQVLDIRPPSQLIGWTNVLAAYTFRQLSAKTRWEELVTGRKAGNCGPWIENNALAERELDLLLPFLDHADLLSMLENCRNETILIAFINQVHPTLPPQALADLFFYALRREYRDLAKAFIPLLPRLQNALGNDAFETGGHFTWVLRNGHEEVACAMLKTQNGKITHDLQSIFSWCLKNNLKHFLKECLRDATANKFFLDHFNEIFEEGLGAARTTATNAEKGEFFSELLTSGVLGPAYAEPIFQKIVLIEGFSALTTTLLDRYAISDAAIQRVLPSAMMANSDSAAVILAHPKGTCITLPLFQEGINNNASLWCLPLIEQYCSGRNQDGRRFEGVQLDSVRSALIDWEAAQAREAAFGGPPHAHAGLEFILAFKSAFSNATMEKFFKELIPGIKQPPAGAALDPIPQAWLDLFYERVQTTDPVFVDTLVNVARSDNIYMLELLFQRINASSPPSILPTVLASVDNRSVLTNVLNFCHSSPLFQSNWSHPDYLNVVNAALIKDAQIGQYNLQDPEIHLYITLLKALRGRPGVVVTDVLLHLTEIEKYSGIVEICTEMGDVNFYKRIFQVALDNGNSKIVKAFLDSDRSNWLTESDLEAALKKILTSCQTDVASEKTKLTLQILLEHPKYRTLTPAIYSFLLENIECSVSFHQGIISHYQNQIFNLFFQYAKEQTLPIEFIQSVVNKLCEKMGACTYDNPLNKTLFMVLGDARCIQMIPTTLMQTAWDSITQHFNAQYINFYYAFLDQYASRMGSEWVQNYWRDLILNRRESLPPDFYNRATPALLREYLYDRIAQNELIAPELIKSCSERGGINRDDVPWLLWDLLAKEKKEHHPYQIKNILTILLHIKKELVAPAIAKEMLEFPRAKGYVDYANAKARYEAPPAPTTPPAPPVPTPTPAPVVPPSGTTPIAANPPPAQTPPANVDPIPPNVSPVTANTAPVTEPKTTTPPNVARVKNITKKASLQPTTFFALGIISSVGFALATCLSLQYKLSSYVVYGLGSGALLSVALLALTYYNRKRIWAN